ncbi:uncharacterized protein LOC126823695 [Patella vulgata]|uniref:uncharacterized protein LOC126823695 n=1 Tax=Patella vulgata TaxID=6465 RepID=UPI0024A9BCA6|nr:uncharacterized protein LOC126823695 [Patella vulgata]
MISVTYVKELKQESHTDFKNLFQPLQQIAKWTGLHSVQIGKESRFYKVKRVLLWIYLLVIYSVMLSAPVKSVFTILYNDPDDGRIIPLLALFVFFLASAYITVASYFSVSKYFSSFCGSLNEHQRLYRNIRINLFIKICCKWANWIVGVFAVTTTIFYCCCTFYMQDDFADAFRPFSFNGVYNTVLTMSYISSNAFFLLAHQVILNMFLIVTFKLFLMQFSDLNERLETGLAEKSPSLQEKTIETIRLEYSSLLACFEITNSIIRHYLFALYAMCIPIVCFLLYGFLRGKLTRGESLALIILVVFIVFFVLVHTIIGAVFSIRAHSPLNVLMKFDILSITDKAARSVLLFLSRINGPTIGYHVYELFTLDTNTALAMIGTLLTYGIVMLQFSESGSSGNSVCNNKTSITS